MRKQFDLIVIGTGSAASTVAHECRSAGWEVAVIDSRPFGGTCALRGCDPKKVLVGAADVLDSARRMKGRGVHGEQLIINWTELMHFKRTFTEPITQAKERSYGKAGIAMFHGAARFTGVNTIAIDNETLQAKHIVIAVGMKPAQLGIPGED